MPFGLKNADATYQRLVNTMFNDQIGDTIEVYIDDMLVKLKAANDHVSHLQQSFHVIRRFGMKLNPTKCSFGVSTSKFLGYIVTQQGIEAKPDQIKAILNIQSPRNLKEVQKLIGHVVVLNRFISESSDRCRLFYDVLKKNKGFEWTNEHDQSSVSVVFAREGQEGQLPIYYEVYRSSTPKPGILHWRNCARPSISDGVQKLKHYFEAHAIHVKTNYPIKSILRRPELTRRMSKWAITFNSYDITYQPRTAIKSQALVTSVADFSPRLEVST